MSHEYFELGLKMFLPFFFSQIQQAARGLKGLDQEKLAAKADLQPLLSKDPNASFALPLKLNNAENKYDGLSALADLYATK